LPIVVHLLTRRRPRPQVFPALALLRRREAGRRQRNKLRDRAVLALRALALLLAALAGAGLLWQGVLRGDDARPAVIILDASASMRQRGVWPEAKAVTGRLIEGLAPRPVQLIVTGTPQRRSGPTPSAHNGDALALLAEAEPGFGDGDPAQAVATALAALADTGGDIHLVTDLGRTSLAGIDPQALNANVALHLLDAGGGGDNVAIRGLALEPGLARVNADCRVLVQVANYSAEAVTGRVHLRAGTHTTSLELSLAAGATTELAHTLQFDSLGAVPVEAELVLSGAAAARDALADDNRRSGSFTVIDAIPTIVVSDAPAEETTTAAWPLLAALRACDLTASVIDASSLSLEAAPGGLLITAGVRAEESDPQALVGPLTEAIGSHLRAGGTWLQVIDGPGDLVLTQAASNALDQAPPMQLGELIDVSEQERGHQLISQARLEHPLLQSFAQRGELLRGIHTYRYHLTPTGQAADAAVLLGYDDGSLAMCERPALGGRWVSWNCSPSAVMSDLAATDALPLLVNDLLATLVPKRRERLAYDVGALVSAQALRDPTGNPVPSLDGHGQLIHCGLYRRDGGALLAAAIPPLESDLRRVDPALLSLTANSADTALAQVGTRPLWPWALLLALLALGAELCLLAPLRRSRS
jgi:hypothetical protein